MINTKITLNSVHTGFCVFQMIQYSVIFPLNYINQLISLLENTLKLERSFYVKRGLVCLQKSKIGHSHFACATFLWIIFTFLMGTR